MMNLIEILPATSSVHERPWDEPLAFPNPVAGRYTSIEIRVPEVIRHKTVTATLFDVTGNVLLHKTLEPNSTSTSFDVHDAPAGTYYVRLTDGGSFSNTDMIVLVR